MKNVKKRVFYKNNKKRKKRFLHLWDRQTQLYGHEEGRK